MPTFYQKLAKSRQEIIKKTPLSILVLGTFQVELQSLYPTLPLKEFLRSSEAPHRVDTVNDIPDNEIPPSVLKTRQIATYYEYVFVVLTKGTTLAEATSILPLHMDKMVIFSLDGDKNLTEFDLNEFKLCGLPIHSYKDEGELLKLAASIVQQLQFRKCVTTQKG